MIESPHAKFNLIVSEAVLDDPTKRDALVRTIATALPNASLDLELLESVGIVGVDCDEIDRATLATIEGIDAIEVEQKRSKRG